MRKVIKQRRTKIIGDAAIVCLRLPADMVKQLRATAQRELRSLSAQITLILQQSMNGEQHDQ